MVNKILGYILLAVGLIIIIATCWQSYNIFTGKVVPPQIFKTEEYLASTPSKNLNVQDLQKQMESLIEKEISNQFKQILPENAISQILNLVSWSVLSWILIFAGGVISSIGAKLLKN